MVGSTAAFRPKRRAGMPVSLSCIHTEEHTEVPFDDQLHASIYNILSSHICAFFWGGGEGRHSNEENIKRPVSGPNIE